MIRALIEEITGQMSESEFKEALAITTADIRHNRISWSKRTRLDETIKIAARSVVALRRCS